MTHCCDKGDECICIILVRVKHTKCWGDKGDECICTILVMVKHTKCGGDKGDESPVIKL